VYIVRRVSLPGIGIVIFFAQEEAENENINNLIEQANAQANARDDAQATAVAESRMAIEEEEEQEDRGEVKALAPGDDVTYLVKKSHLRNHLVMLSL
jgi:hypothetical protein